MAKPSRGLGRGLSALMADVEAAPRDSSGNRRAEQRVAIEKIMPNPDQPRRSFSDESLADLAASIRTKGVLQPLIVRPRPGHEGEYEIVAGERRWRASQKAQMHELPVIVRDYDDTEMLEVAIIENIQREDLNPVDEAQGFRQLMDRFGHTQEALAEALGKSRSHIANQMRLLQLPESVLEHLREARISSGHARALITSDDPEGLARQVVKDGLSVRATEALVRKSAQGDPEPRRGKSSSAASGSKDADTKALEGDLSAATGLKVSVDHDTGKESGSITIRYETLDQLDDLCRILSNG